MLQSLWDDFRGLEEELKPPKEKKVGITVTEEALKKIESMCDENGMVGVRPYVFGGGCSGMATAFDLTRPELEGQYQVTVYQQGFRLGGKGASGRGPADRIEEHGLHIFMGFYENAFRLIRECYKELGREPGTRFADWDDVFKPDRLTGVKDDHHDGTASHWLTWFPPGAGTPGDPDAPPRTFSASEYCS